MKTLITLTLLFFSIGCSVHNSDEGLNSSLSGSCSDVLAGQFKQQIYPFFRQTSTCIHCHIEGGAGLGLFASPDPLVSYAAFTAAGVSTVGYMATNPQHQPPYTGVQNKAAVDTFTAQWNQDQTDYLGCVSKNQNGGLNQSILTSAQGAPQIYANTATKQTLTWNLNLASDVDASTGRSVPAIVSVDVQILTQNSIAQGYIFSNPTIQLTDTTQEIVVEGLYFQINHQPISSQTTFTYLSRVISGPLQIPLMSNVQANTLIQPVSTQDVFQLYFQRLAPTAGVAQTPPPLTPILLVADSDTGSTTLIKSRTAKITILRDAGIARWCLSESPTAPPSTQDACQSSATGTGVLNGWQNSRPMSYTFSNGDGSKTLYLWVADQNLQMNAVAGQVSVTLDTVAPAAPTINSITVGSTQVAAMSLSHPNPSDVAGWCVIEQNAILQPPGTPDLNDVCWNWSADNTMPTTVGFKNGGTRDVWVFVRDRAGNISAPSNMMSSTNPYGAITFSQLTSSGGATTAVFRNNCYACHATQGNPGYAALQLFNYSEAIKAADNGLLVQRINNPISPMPNVNGGLMDQALRDLIKLWTLPEQSSEPLP